MSNSNNDEAIIDHVLVEFNMSCRVDSAINSVVGILAENKYGISELSSDFGRSINDLEGIEFMVVDTSAVTPTSRGWVRRILASLPRIPPLA